MYELIQAHPRWSLALTLGFALLVLLALRAWFRWFERRTLRSLELRHHDLVERQVQVASQEIRDTAREILEDARERRIPLQIVAGTPEDAADLRTLLENGHVSVGTVGVDVYPDGRRIPMSRRRPKPVENRDDIPTAWARILADDPDEEVAPCPTNPVETAKKKPKSRPLPKPKPPKMV